MPTASPPPLPLVISPAPLLSTLIVHLLHSKHPATLLVCSDRSTFMCQLRASVKQEVATSANQQQQSDGLNLPQGPHPLLQRTLRTLSACENIKVVFCDSVPVLWAYLASLSLLEASSSGGVQGKDADSMSRLVLVNPLRLHEESAYSSAQGLGRTFAAAVKAAWHLQQGLSIVECLRVDEAAGDGEAGDDVQMHDVDEAEAQPAVEHEDVGVINTTRDSADPWETRIPVVSATTRAFGIGGNRAWMDKTTRARDVAARWCVFGPMK